MTMRSMKIAGLVVVAGVCMGASAVPSAQVVATVAPATAANTAAYLVVKDTDIVVGSPSAPVTIINYSSMTCPHCADLSTETMPMVKKEWIDTGKAKYVYRDLAWDNLALGMAKVVRCAAPTQRLALAEAMFASQKDIVLNPNPLDGIKKISMLAGLDGAKVDACVKDAELQKQVLDEKETAMQKLNVKGTPTLFVNGTRVDGFVPYKDLKKTLAAEYAKATMAKK
jgi:protein-disulfide isomerase